MKLNYLAKIILLALAVLIMQGSAAKADDYTDAMAKAKSNLKAAMNTYDEKALVKVRGEFERILQLKQDTWLVNYYMGLVDYNLAVTGMLDGKNIDMEKIKKYTQSGLEALNKSIDAKDDFADAYVMQVYLNFNRWNYESDKMNDIIAATQQALTKAEQLDASNPRLALAKGISNFYMPEAFGGGYKTALPELEKSSELFASRKEASELYPDWGSDLAYGYTALALLQRNDDGDRVKSKALIDKALAQNPDSGFIKNYVSTEYEKAGK